MRRAPTKLKAMLDAANVIMKANDSPDGILPLFTYYRSTRLARKSYFDEPALSKRVRLRDRMAAYQDCIDALSDASRFKKWYGTHWRAVKSAPAVGTTDNRGPLSALSAVREAVAAVLAPTGWMAIDWDPDNDCVVVEHREGQRLPLAWLSSGIRSTIALTADLAYRCARLNPHLRSEAAQATPGIVLIDEVDLHLHPSWQQQVVALLMEAFHQCQFVLTTHSPQVLSTVDSESVRVVKHGCDGSSIEQPTFQTRGVESADVLARVMSVDPVPRIEQAEWLSTFRMMIQRGNHRTAEAGALWSRLVAHFGGEHPVLEELSVLRRLQDFKAEHGLNQESQGGGHAQA